MNEILPNQNEENQVPYNQTYTLSFIGLKHQQTKTNSQLQFLTTFNTIWDLQSSCDKIFVHGFSSCENFQV